ncbi:hypothetical protein WJX72_011835 [[Myrmecia] bisecta]|uniref:Protein FAM221A n=1 Tax=[Myrmecia] bisecta TaxID=41462 RepID=A0AAW1PEL8_9CHLO
MESDSRRRDRIRSLNICKNRRRAPASTELTEVQGHVVLGTASSGSVLSAHPSTVGVPGSANCQRECIPIRSESRCLCGHRLKEHGSGNKLSNFRCHHAKCACKAFFYIVAEGSWILRCRCKHRHTEHDAVMHACAKTNCPCPMFDSPWVCNCNCPWSEHRQVLVKRKVMSMEAMMAGLAMGTGPGPADELNRWDLLKRGLD